MIKSIKKGNALILTTVILFAVSTIAAGLTMYFYHASIVANNTNIYLRKRVDLENEFNKNYLKALSGENSEMRDFFQIHSQTSMAFLDGDYYSTIRKIGEEGGKFKFTYEIETSYKPNSRRECHLIKTIYNEAEVLSVDSQEVFYVFDN